MAENNNKIVLTSNAEIEKLTPPKTCELIGVVDAIEATKRYPTKQVFKFVLSNTTGMRVQVNVWNDEIPRTQQEIMMDHVIHLENAACVPNTEFNKGNYHGAEVAIRKYTVVENFGKYDKNTCRVIAIEPEIFKMISLEEIGDSVLPWKFRYVKTRFTTIKAEKEDFTKGFLSLTDGERKLNVNINSYDENHAIEKGDHVELVGSIFQLKNNMISFVVESMEDIRITDEDKKPLNWLLQGKKQIVLKNNYKKIKFN